MLSEQLIEQIRRASYIGSGALFSEYTDAVVLREATEQLRTLVGESVVAARAGYWLTSFEVDTASRYVRYPERAMVGGLEGVGIRPNADSTQYYPLDELSPRDADRLDRVQSTIQPRWFASDAETITLVPAPSASVHLRVRYYIRPSRLVKSQSDTRYGDLAVRGRITALFPSLKGFTVNALPLDQLLTAPAAITSGYTVDVVRPHGWHTALVCNKPCTVSGSDVYITETSDEEFSKIAVGDFVRVADQTDWPAIPSDYHQLLAEVTAAKVLMDIGDIEKSAAVTSGASGDFARFRASINPRVKSSPRRIGLRPYWRG